MTSYPVLKQITSDKKGTREERIFLPGETVKDSDFSKAVIKNWLEIGVLGKPKKKKSKSKGGILPKDTSAFISEPSSEIIVEGKVIPDIEEGE